MKNTINLICKEDIEFKRALNNQGFVFIKNSIYDVISHENRKYIYLDGYSKYAISDITDKEIEEHFTIIK